MSLLTVFKNRKAYKTILALPKHSADYEYLTFSLITPGEDDNIIASLFGPSHLQYYNSEGRVNKLGLGVREAVGNGFTSVVQI